MAILLPPPLLYLHVSKVCLMHPGYTRYVDRTSVYLCASPLQNLAVPHDFYSPLSISLERSGLPDIRWCGIGWFREQVQCLFVGLVALSLFLSSTISLSLLFLYRLVVWGWGLWTDRAFPSSCPGLALPIFFNNNNNNNSG